MLRTVPLAIIAFFCALPTAFAAEVELLPDLSVHLQAARYAPVETDFHWNGWIGAGAGLLRVESVTTYFSADVETIIGDTLRTFEANQANYHLETGLRRPVGRHQVTLFFHHVSRHYVDRPKIQAVDWNVLGVRMSGLLGSDDHPVRYAASVGHTTLASLVGYRFEVTAHADTDVLGSAARAVYLAADARLVTIEKFPDLDRGSFLDLSGEAGLRLRQAKGELDLFATYERRNDVFLEVPGRKDRGLIGFRITSGPLRR
jgi:hypothetical protein